MIGNRKFFATAAVTSALAFGALQMTPALATPAEGFTRAGFIQGEFGALHTISHKDDRWPAWDLLFKTKAATDIGVDELTVQVDGHSGWHSHAGPLYITVRTGQITVFDGTDCSSRTYHAGDTFIEPAHKVHLGENQGDVITTFVAVAPRPHGAPGRLDEPEPECAAAS
jgi:quercetin dioxygenase-like cupin family protein